MNVENMRKWESALRSGQYYQTSRKLANSSRTHHCCLGVACEVAIKNGVEMLVDSSGEDDLTSFDLRTATLPGAVINFLGSNEICPAIFMVMNDEEGKTFTEIADYIDEQIREYEQKQPKPDDLLVYSFHE